MALPTAAFSWELVLALRLLLLGRDTGTTSLRFELVRDTVRNELGGGSPWEVRAKVLLESAALTGSAPLGFPVGRGECANSGFELELELFAKVPSG